MGKTRKEVLDWLNGFQWKRMSLAELTEKCNGFFGCEKEELQDTTDDDDVDLDYAVAYTNERGSSNEEPYTLIDVEFYYLPMRNGKDVLITETSLLTYIEDYK